MVAAENDTQNSLFLLFSLSRYKCKYHQCIVCLVVPTVPLSAEDISDEKGEGREGRIGNGLVKDGRREEVTKLSVYVVCHPNGNEQPDGTET